MRNDVMGSWQHHSLSFQAYALFPTMQIASLGKARRQGGSSITFVQPRILHFWSRVSIPHQWYRYRIPTPEFGYRVVYRSWTFGFDSSIPRVTTSGRVCD
ncbi:hypothetical protein GQ457_10G014660 [Hibiscus cannabinus]